MATYHQCLVLLATSLVVGLLPRTVLGQGEQHVNFCCLVVLCGWVGVNKRAAVSVDWSHVARKRESGTLLI